MVHLILTGATGLVGSAVLHQMLINPSVSKISILSRRSVPQADSHSKASVIIQTDFNIYPPSILDQLKDAAGVVWAQGISVTQVTKEEYQKISYDYPLAAAKAFATNASPKPFRFVYVSGEGATTEPGFFTPHFGVTKGRAEAALLALSKDPSYPNFKPFSVRPGGVDPSAHPEIHEFMPEKTGLAHTISDKLLLPVFRTAYKSMVSPTKELGQVLMELAMDREEPFEGKGYEGEGRTIPNAMLRKLAGI